MTAMDYLLLQCTVALLLVVGTNSTASVKVPGFNSLELDEGNFVVDQMCEIGKPEPLNEEEARGWLKIMTMKYQLDLVEKASQVRL